MKFCAHAFYLAMTLGLSGCVTPATWTYDGVNYPNSTAATEAIRVDVHRKVAAVTERDGPIAGTALIYTPSVDWSRRAIWTTGAVTEEQTRYLATSVYYGFYSMAEGIKRRHIFDTTDIKQFARRDPSNDSTYDYIIWPRLDGPDKAQWFIAPGNDISAASPIAISPISEPGDRIFQFVESVEQHVAGLDHET